MPPRAKAAWRRYEATKPKQLGNLHQRAKYAAEIAHKINIMLAHYDYKFVPSDLQEALRALLWAVWDLATEAGHYGPVNPPYGSR
jgi:hypothetical protein